MKIETTQNLDLQHNWHPAAQMKDYEQFKPLVIERAFGSYIELTDGHLLIDAISSWWCKSLGHNHPALKKALQEQIEKFEHVIFAHTTHEVIAKLAQKLASYIPSLNKIFYAGDGSSAIEVAMKMSLHSRVVEGVPEKNRFIALTNGYHGETIGALSVSDISKYKNVYKDMLFTTILIEPFYILHREEASEKQAEAHWKMIESTLEQYHRQVTAIIFEPLLQGTAGMKLYHPYFLKKLACYAKKHDIHLIADEIMTGIGRTGRMFACQHVNITPDFMCLSKGLTSGWMPFSVVLTTNDIYQTFYDDNVEKAFLHSHTHSGNAMGASLALATLQVIEAENLCARAFAMQALLQQHMQSIALETGALNNIRGLGAVVAADLINPKQIPRLGYRLYQEAVKLGVLLRPIGNTVYWMPPLNISDDTLHSLSELTLQAISNTCSI